AILDFGFRNHVEPSGLDFLNELRERSRKEGRPRVSVQTHGEQWSGIRILMSVE
ncbi:hypothetical protein AVEN_62274-1, partial [Araneus ventricosus]